MSATFSLEPIVQCSGSVVPEGSSVWESTCLPLSLPVPSACMGGGESQGAMRSREA